MAVLLCVPAGVGAATILGAARAAMPRRRLVGAIAAGALVVLCSLLVPSASLARSEEAAAHANRASAYAEADDPIRAETEARRALALDSSSVPARYNLAVIVAASGRTADAERLYREVLALDPAHAESAGNLAKLLVERGAAAEAVPILETALAHRPGDPTCWTNLVVAFLAMNDAARARRALADGRQAGVPFTPDLVAAVEKEGR
jgi:Tfp pilus assembly protein PilF